MHSSTKAARDAATKSSPHRGRARRDRCAGDPCLAGPKTRLKTKVAAEEAAITALTTAGAARWVGFTIIETSEAASAKNAAAVRAARPATGESEKPIFMISAAIRAEAVAYDAITDGCFPIITNDTVMTPAEVLLLCHFLAMLAEALIEREIRTSMKNAGLTGIPLYPELRNCPDPSAPRILEIFSDIQRHHLISGGQVVQTFEPRLTPLQQQVRDLLHIPASVYTPTSAP